MTYPLPEPVEKVLNAIEEAGFEAFIVGGSVRDLLYGSTPRDWDITTNAKPEEIQKLFPESFYENEYGTVGVKVPRFLLATEEKKEHDVIEVTTYRTESHYNDRRHPDTVAFAKNLEDDLGRRDFTINAMSYGRKKKEEVRTLVDPFNGQEDLERKIIRTVHNPEDRFEEDALRLMRAIRLWAELGSKNNSEWHIDKETFAAIVKKSENIQAIALERIRDEFAKIMLSHKAAAGIDMLQKAGLLRFIIPELELGINCTQNLHHIYTVYEHNVRALDTVPSDKLAVRLAALLHDIGKPHTKKGEGKYATFYNHDHVGARIAEKILTRLRFSKDVVQKATLLVDNHMFFYNVDEVTEASVRRLIKRVGLENMGDLMAVRIGDRLGSGVPKAKPYKLRHLEYMVEKVSRDPVSVKMLALSGTDLMKEAGIPAGPKIGALLDVLLAEVIEDPGKNTKEKLFARVEELMHTDLASLRTLAKDSIEEKKESDVSKIKKRHWVE